MAEAKSGGPVKFTKGRVDAFTCPPERRDVVMYDAVQTGLALRAFRGGAVTYWFQRRFNGKVLKVKIGDRATWLLEEARNEAKRLSVMVDKGIDPRQDRADRLQAASVAERERARAVATVGTLFAAFLEARRPDWSPGHLKEARAAMAAPGQPRLRSRKKTVAGPLWALRDLRLTELSPGVLTAWLTRETKRRPTRAALSYRVLRSCLNWADGQPEFEGLADPRAVMNVEVRRRVPRARARTDCLQKEQLRDWFTAVRGLDELPAVYLQTLLVTGARPGELIELRWADIDFQWGTIRIRDKVEGTRAIPLTAYVAAILERLPRRNEYVFSSATARSGRMYGANDVHNRALATTDLPHLTLHGLRRSFGTLSEWVEVPVGVVAQIMGHKPSALAEKHYRQRPIDLLRKWHQRIEDFITQEAALWNRIG